MLFKGTARRSGEEIDRLMNRVGADLNGYADKEYTCYYVRCLSEHIPLALDVLADMVQHARFDAEDIAREHNVVAEEIAHYLDSPEQMVEDLLLEGLWDGHPLSYNALGSLDDVRRLTQEDFRRFVRSRYAPANIIVAAAGDIQHEQMVSLVHEHFDLNGELPANWELPSPRANSTKRILERDSAQAHVALGVPGHRRAHDDVYAERVISTALGGGTASRLFREVRERRGLTYSVGSYSAPFSCGGFFALYAGARAEAIPEIVGLFRQQLADLAAHGLSREELAETKEQLAARLELSLDDIGARMEHLAESWMYYGRLLSVEEILARLAKVSLSDVRRVSERMFANGPAALAAIGAVDADMLEGG